MLQEYKTLQKIENPNLSKDEFKSNLIYIIKMSNNFDQNDISDTIDKLVDTYEKSLRKRIVQEGYEYIKNHT